MEPAVLVGFAMACVVLNLVPGPGMLFITPTGSPVVGVLERLLPQHGQRHVVHTAAAALGLGALLRVAPFALDAVRIVGALVLVYLAVSALRSADGPGLAAPRRSLRRTYWSAVLTNLANPKVVLFFLAFVPQFVTSGGWSPTAQITVLGGVLVVIGLVLDCVIGLASGTFAALLARRPAVRRWLRRVSAAVFGGLALRLLADAR